MHIDIIYSKDVPFLHVKKKSKVFFYQTGYVHRNNVFVHPEIDSVFALNRNTIHISIPDNDNTTQKLANSFLKSVFGHTRIGVCGASKQISRVVSALNYITV